MVVAGHGGANRHHRRIFEKFCDDRLAAGLRGGAKIRGRCDGLAGAEYVYVRGGIHSGGSDRGTARYHSRRGRHGRGISQAARFVCKRIEQHPGIPLPVSRRRILCVGEYRRDRLACGGSGAASAGGSWRCWNCGSSIWPCREKLSAILAGQRTPPAWGSAGAYAASVFPLARGGCEVGQVLLPVGFCGAKKLEVRKGRKRKRTDKSVCPTKSRGKQ